MSPKMIVAVAAVIEATAAMILAGLAIAKARAKAHRQRGQRKRKAT